MAVQGQEQHASNPVLLEVLAPETEWGLAGPDQDGLAELCFLQVTGGVQLPSELLPGWPQSLGCRKSEG